jgi:hypothetical protein
MSSPMRWAILLLVTIANFSPEQLVRALMMQHAAAQERPQGMISEDEHNRLSLMLEGGKITRPSSMSRRHE